MLKDYSFRQFDHCPGFDPALERRGPARQAAPRLGDRAPPSLEVKLDLDDKCCTCYVFRRHRSGGIQAIVAECELSRPDLRGDTVVQLRSRFTASHEKKNLQGELAWRVIESLALEWRQRNGP